MIDLIRAVVQREWPLRLLSPLFGRYKPFHPNYRQDPYSTYARLREDAPIYRHPLFRFWVLSRHADIVRVLKDPRFSVDHSQAKLPNAFNPMRQMSGRFIDAIHSLLLTLDPPGHTRIRSLVTKAFTPRRVETFRPRIQQVVDETLDQLVGCGEIELMRDFAIPVPLRVITDMLGVPSEDIALFGHWSTCFTSVLDPINGEVTLQQAGKAFDELDTYFRNLFENRRQVPRDDLVSALVAVHEEGDRLSELELLAIVFLMLGAGHETTTSLIGNAVVALMRHPDELKRLREDPTLIETAVEEFLRYDAPVQATERVLTEDVEIGGVWMKKGEVVLCLLGSANHDPAVFEEPERLDIGRKVNPHLAFSQGPHFCLGAQLARTEGQVALTNLLARLPQLSCAGDDINWRSSIFLRRPRALPLAFRIRPIA